MSTPSADGSGAMFDRIAARYDLLNRVLSLGLDRGWRRALVTALRLQPGQLALDLATGTGDVALAIAGTTGARVVGLDPSPGMLQVARRKGARRACALRLSWLVGDAQALPFPADHFDASCIAFGIRNLPDRAAGLREMARVTRRGERVVVLELGEPRTGALAGVVRFHTRRVLPRVGALLSGEAEYRYLQSSVAAFPPPEEFGALLEACDLQLVEIRRLGLGAANLYVATAP